MYRMRKLSQQRMDLFLIALYDRGPHKVRPGGPHNEAFIKPSFRVWKLAREI